MNNVKIHILGDFQSYPRDQHIAARLQTLLVISRWNCKVSISSTEPHSEDQDRKLIRAAKIVVVLHRQETRDRLEKLLPANDRRRRSNEKVILQYDLEEMRANPLLVVNKWPGTAGKYYVLCQTICCLVSGLTASANYDFLDAKKDEKQGVKK